MEIDGNRTSGLRNIGKLEHLELLFKGKQGESEAYWQNGQGVFIVFRSPRFLIAEDYGAA